MQLKVLFFAALRDQAGTAEFEFSSPSPLSVTELTEAIGERNPELRDALRLGGVRVAVNEEFVNAEHTLRDGDEVAFIPPVSGG